MASGSLYGLADEGVPSDELIAPIKPHTFVQMPPGGTQQPTGDTLDVWKQADRNGADVVVRLVDYYPGWPYRFTWETTEAQKGWEDAVRGMIADIEAAGATNIVAYAPWNEPDLTWREENGSFNDFWEFTYNLLREELGPDVPIQGPAFSTDISEMREFLEFAVATDTVPDVLEWHELIDDRLIKGHVEEVQVLLNELGIGDLPIDITEYATPQEVGIPGSLVGYVAKLERYGIDRAELPFWNQSGALGDLLTGRGGDPNGAYWLYTWYADMNGDMVTTTPPSNESPLDGAASVSEAKDEVRVITGGNSGPTSIVVNGLDELALGDNVNVKLEATPSYGRTTPTTAPITISNTTYVIGSDGSITVPIVMNPAYGYHVVVTPEGASESLAGTYTIQNDNSDLLLASTDDGAAIQAAADDGDDQVWSVVDAGSGLYKVVNSASGLVLGVRDGSTSNGALATVTEDSEAEHQLWQLIPDGKGSVRLANYGTGRTLGVQEASIEPGVPVEQWTDGSQSSGCRADGPRQPGKIGTALDFCNSASHATMPTGVVSELNGDWTISTWIKPAALTQWSRIWDFGSGQGANMFLTVSAGNGPRFAITTGGGGAEQQVTYSGQNFTLDQWSHVTVTVSGTTATMYINGQAVATNSNLTIHPSALGNTTRNYIGKSQYSNDPAFNGAVDDFAIYNKALTAQEVAALAGGQPATGSILNYAFDETNNYSVALDSSGTNRHGSIVSGTGTGVSTTATDEQTPDRFWTLVPATQTVAVTPEMSVTQPTCDVRGSVTGIEATGIERFVLRAWTNGTLGVEIAQDVVDAGTYALQAFPAEGATLTPGEGWDSIAGGAVQTIVQIKAADCVGPDVSVKDGGQFTTGKDGRYSKVSFKLHDDGKIDRLSLNGVEKDLTDNVWSDLNGVTPGTFGAVEGENTLVVYDVAGNNTTVTFTLDTRGPQVSVKDGAQYTVSKNGTYMKVSYKLQDEGQVDRLTLNGVEKDLTNNVWSDLDKVVIGKFGAVKGVNTLIVYDSLGNATTVNFTLVK